MEGLEHTPGEQGRPARAIAEIDERAKKKRAYANSRPFFMIKKLTG